MNILDELKAQVPGDTTGWELCRITKDVKFFDNSFIGLKKGEITIGHNKPVWMPGVIKKTGEFKMECFQTVPVYSPTLGMVCQIGVGECMFE